MESKKMIGTIEKKLDVKVEKVLGVTQEGNEMQVDVSIGSGNCWKVCLKEMKNQYGPYYKITFSESYEMPVEEKKPTPKKDTKLRTKTEQPLRSQPKSHPGSGRKDNQKCCGWNG